jgi:sterol desaturase/sphingolipid hydroxylase (fatty acid hydroxylase superfamily)
VFLQSLLSPTLGAVVVIAVNALGGGAIVLPDRGWGLALGVIAYFVAMDLGEYAYHRAQHAIPWLWSLHSLHHSDPAVNVSTTLRHFWLESCIKTICIYPLVALVFKVNVTIIGVYAIISFYNFFAHMDIRVGFGRWSWVANSPQYHRLHHSSRSGDEDCNFAAILPVFDVLTGAYRGPRPGDFPRTGLVDEPGPSGLLEAIAWPLRGAMRARRVGSVVSTDALR